MIGMLFNRNSVTISLSTDMPVHLVFTGRQTTFGDYLIEPFWAFLSQAMQD